MATTAPVRAERERLAALHRYAALDTPREESFDRLVRLASRVMGVPIAAISLVDTDRVWMKAEIGLGLTEVPRRVALCNRTIGSSDPIYELHDIKADATLLGNPLFEPPVGMQFYAAAALETPEGARIGALCVIDRRKRPPLTPDERATLIDLAGTIMIELERRRAHALREAAAARLALINDVLVEAGGATGFVAATEAVMARLCRHTGAISGQLWTNGTGPEMRALAFATAGDVTPDRHAAFVDSFAEAASLSRRALPPRDDRTVLIADLTAARAARWPLLRAGYELGVRACLLQPLSVGNERFALVLCFGSPHHDLPAVADLVAEVGRALRPLLLRKQAEDRLALLQLAVDSAADALVVTEPAGVARDARVLRVNAAFTRMTGYSAEETLGRNMRFLQGPETDPATVARLHEAVGAGRPVREELLNYRRDGTPFWVELDIAPFTDERGGVASWVGVLRDTTDRHMTQDALCQLARALRERSTELSELARLARIGAWSWRADTKVIEWSDENYELFGVTRETYTPTLEGFFGLLHPDDVRAARIAGRQAMRTGQEAHVEARIRLPGGRVRRIVWSCLAHRDANGRIAGMHGYCQDITERRETEAVLRHGEKLRVLGNLTGGIAHEFNNLLTVVQANLEMALATRAPLAEARAELEAARRAALAGTALTKRLLSFARADTLHRIPADLAGVLGSLREMAARTLGVRFRLVLRPAALPPVPVDRSQLEGAVLNLILNARDAMPGGGEIAIETDRIEVRAGAHGPLAELRSGDYAVVAVRDGGSGMAPDIAEHAFEPFFTTKASGNGTGLGLSMVQTFARQSGGIALIETAPGRGTVVRILLPMA